MELPADLITEILLRLPVKSIVRFKSLGKAYHRLFKTATFVSRHRSLGKKNGHNLLVHYFDGNPDIMHLFDGEAMHLIDVKTMHFLGDETNRTDEKYRTGMLLFADEKTFVSYRDLRQQLPYDLPAKKHYSPVVEDGLVCFYNVEDNSMILWNPATKESRLLPDPDPDCNQHIPPRKNPYYTFFGCGMDPLSNDYKVIVQRYGPRYDFKRQYAVYSMSSDSWRVLKEEEVEIVGELRTVVANLSHTCVNGVCHWQVYLRLPAERNFERKLLAFDLSTEVFQILGPPIPGKLGTLISLHDGRIAVWETPLCRECLNTSDVAKPCAVWVLNDEGNRWTKLITIDPSPKVRKIYGYWTHGKVFVEHEGEQLLLYDLETGEFSEPGFEGYRARVYTYKESLLTVKRE